MQCTSRLHLLCINKHFISAHHEAALAVVNHDRWKEILLLPTWVLGTYTLGFVRYLPDICMVSCIYNLHLHYMISGIHSTGSPEL